MRVFVAMPLILLLAVPAVAQPAPATVDACFIPGGGCGARIVAAIDAAHAEIRVQAYGFTAAPILAALAAARRRGVDVAVLLDHSDERSLCAHAGALIADGVPVWIDHPHGIAHNKIMVIDHHLVIGGSYNYTARAERRNAENVLFIDGREVAARFLAYWAARQAGAAVFGACPS